MDSINPSDPPSDSAPLIFAHQRAAFESLSAIGRACFSVQRQTIPCRLRTNTLLLGQTGSGKSFLVESVARELGVPFLPVALSNWVILSGTDRGAQTTWVAIADFLHKNRNAAGVVIFLDEVDKLRSTTSSWDQQVQVESFLLLDGRVPKFLKDSDGDLLSDSTLEAAQDMLANRTLIVAAGAFQHLWESRSRPAIGFGELCGVPALPTPDELARSIPREIVNRFSRELIILTPLQMSDYKDMLAAIAPKVPHYLRETFLRIGHEQITEAMAMQQGCRFIEDIMLQTILSERTSLQMLPQKLAAQPEKQSHQKEEKHADQNDLFF